MTAAASSLADHRVDSSESLVSGSVDISAATAALDEARLVGRDEDLGLVPGGHVRRRRRLRLLFKRWLERRRRWSYLFVGCHVRRKGDGVVDVVVDIVVVVVTDDGCGGGVMVVVVVVVVLVAALATAVDAVVGGVEGRAHQAGAQVDRREDEGGAPDEELGDDGLQTNVLK